MWAGGQWNSSAWWRSGRSPSGYHAVEREIALGVRFDAERECKRQQDWAQMAQRLRGGGQENGTRIH